MQTFYDTTGYLYAVRFWRLVIYVDNRAESLRFGGIVTSIGLARFLFWRFSWVGARPTKRAADDAYCTCQPAAVLWARIAQDCPKCGKPHHR